ncbi:universal stress protein [Marinifilum flexuosum]|uniref:Nucleotide-binding universal stress UspA family protein n=1 Tax=Marinifilum flexuosum TaxID=1117708 RepID=A0A419X6M8_9BACT|nr:universal stress protein [Marinifilum flexuosum]RKE03210.1 nucleotide-binding universal stress UspA family protein [Marinifilum flexuosum]
MESTKRSLLVAWDFSTVAEYALDHASIFAENVEAEVILVHIVKKESQLEEAKVKMAEAVEKIYKEKNIRPEFIVRDGSIFTTINDVAKEMNAMLVLMGTHGIKGMQKLTGSWALKVIVGSRVPFVVVQAPPVQKKYSSVVLPVDFKKENKEKLSWAEFLGKFFKAKMRIITPKMPEGQMLQRTKANLVFAKKYLESRGIDYEIDTADGGNDFAMETVEFAKKIDADIILIMTTKNISFQDYMLGAHEQFVIANSAHIPVMCVNPRTDLSKYGSFY